MKKTVSIVLSMLLIAWLFTACARTENSTPANDYSALPQEDVQTISAPLSSENIQDYDYLEIEKMFTNAGFTNVSTSEVVDIDPDTDNSPYINTVSINGSSDFTDADYFPCNAKVSVVCHKPYEKYDVALHVNFVPNFIFSRYDVELSIDGVESKVLPHGEDADFNFRLRAGSYTVTFSKNDAADVVGSAEFDVLDNMSIAYKIACFRDRVSVEDITAELQAELEAQELEKQRQAAEAEAAKQAAELEAKLETHLPRGMAKRAAIVAITNYCVASDVFMSDGNTYDPSKFHSYADTSGNFFKYYISVNVWGDWSAKNETTWHTENLEYKNCYGNARNASFDVQYDGENYIVSNVITSFGDPSDPSKSGRDEYSGIFTVTPDLVQEDRSFSRLDSYDTWVDSQFSLWNGSHKQLTSIIKERLNDERSYKHIKTTYRTIYSENDKAELTALFQKANKSVNLEIGDIVILTEFSAKNAFNATIKNTAVGVSSFQKNTVTLVLVE